MVIKSVCTHLKLFQLSINQMLELNILYRIRINCIYIVNHIKGTVHYSRLTFKNREFSISEFSFLTIRDLILIHSGVFTLITYVIILT